MTVEEKALALVKRALDYADGMICRHDNCERGGVLWTICQDCGAKWADDTGGFKPSPWPEMLDVALAGADAAIEAHEADKKAFSDAVKRFFEINMMPDSYRDCLSSFILPDPEPDPLEEILAESMEYASPVRADRLRTALTARGYKIERIEQ